MGRRKGVRSIEAPRVAPSPPNSPMSSPTDNSPVATAIDPQPLVTLSGVVKRFGATRALDGVDLALLPGEVHALVGENGAGKSTLGKIVAGVHRHDRGTLTVDGRERSFGSPHDALAVGIAAIQQELALVPDRTVLDNVFLGSESSGGGFLDRSQMHERFQALTGRYGFELPPDSPARNLSIGDQQKVEILRALARDARLIVMDEPTAALNAQETATLLDTIRLLRSHGTAIVYVSHFLEDVLAISDTVTVLRNGARVHTGPTERSDMDELVELMLGRPLERVFPPRRQLAPDADEVLKVDGLCRDDEFHDVSLSIRSGEIVGLAGLVGSGRTEVAKTVFGALRASGGAVAINGREIRSRGPAAAIRAGIAFLPEDRKAEGLHLGLSVAENVSMAHLDQFSPTGLVNGRKRARRVQELIARLDIRPATPRTPVKSLSGGNQQKVMFAKWLVRRPRLLIIDDPTRGVDIGAKVSIYDLIAEVAAEGCAVLLISSELEEVLGLAHRVCVLRRGRIVARFEGEDATYEAVTRASLGAVPTPGAAG